MASKQEIEENVVNVSVDRLWKAMGDVQNLMPKVCPDFIKSIEDHGDGTRTIHYGPAAEKETGSTYLKEKLVVDEANKAVTMTTLEGGPLGKFFESFKAYTKFAPGKDESTTVATMKVEYVPIGGANSDKLKEGSLAMLKAVEAYLQANPAAYA